MTNLIPAEPLSGGSARQLRGLSLLKPRSLGGLILLGCAVIALPLLLGTLSAALEMRRISNASEQLVVNGVTATQYTQSIVRQTSSLERTARLYQILRTPALLDTYLRNRRLLVRTLDDFDKLPGDPARAAVIERMRKSLDEITQGLRSSNAGRVNASLQRFTALARDAGELASLATRQTDRELRELKTETEHTRQRLFWQAAALVPVTLALIGLFAYLLARPIRRIDQAIADIGHGRLNEPVVVRGPRDLEALGGQLEWLRVRLGEISAERNRFLRHMSHELKTPLANIREGSELLMEGAVGALNSEQREVAGILRENSLRLQRLIENLLSYSEWQAKRVGLDLGEVRLQPLFKSAIEVYQLPINVRRLRLDLQVEDIALQADRAKLKLVLDNLISNAVKFTPDGGTLTLRARSSDDGQAVVIDVADSGSGIPLDERERIFEAFYQGATPQGGLVRGTGIGLSVVQEFVHAHGGTVALLDGEFPGAHFQVRLPFVSSEPTALGLHPPE